MQATDANARQTFRSRSTWPGIFSVVSSPLKKANGENRGGDQTPLIRLVVRYNELYNKSATNRTNGV